MDRMEHKKGIYLLLGPWFCHIFHFFRMKNTNAKMKNEQETEFQKLYFN